jgi:plasmid stabilization system protein ParE
VGRGHREAPRPVSRPLTHPPQPIIGANAEAELFELLDYIQRDSPGRARQVAERIIAKIERIRTAPRSAGRLDPDAPPMPEGREARVAAVSGYTIRYVYPVAVPVAVKGDGRVLIVSVRRGVRAALDQPAYVLRWLEELGKLDPPVSVFVTGLSFGCYLAARLAIGPAIQRRARRSSAGTANADLAA